MSKKNEQRLTFVASKTSDGRMKVSMEFYPHLAKSKEEFEAMPMQKREMQNAIADVGRYAMERFAQQLRDKEEKDKEKLPPQMRAAIKSGLNIKKITVNGEETDEHGVSVRNEVQDSHSGSEAPAQLPRLVQTEEGEG